MKKTMLYALFTVASLSTQAQTLIAHWDFTGGSTTDLVNGWTPVAGTVSGTVAGMAGVPNTAVAFNGTSDFLEFKSDPIMDQKSWTFSAIVRPLGQWGGLCQGGWIMSRAPEYSQQHYKLGYFDNAFDNDCFVASPANNVFYAGPAGMGPFPQSEFLGTPAGTNPFIAFGTWYCVTGTYDAPSGWLDVYVNGTLVVSEHGPSPNDWPDQYAFGPDHDLFIGSSYEGPIPFANYPYFLNGELDDLKMYDGALTPAAVAIICNPGHGGGGVGGDGKAATTVTKVNITERIVIAPNPAKEVVNITLPSGWQKAHISIVNAMGSVVVNTQATDAVVTTINVQSLPAGIYAIIAESNGRIIKTKMTK